MFIIFLTNLYICTVYIKNTLKMGINKVDSPSSSGHRQERWDCVQGCKASRDPDPHGDIGGVPEENRPHHRWLHPQPASGGPDWSRGSGGGGVIVYGDQHDEQLWIYWVNIHCCLRCTNPATNTNMCFLCRCNMWTHWSNFILWSNYGVRLLLHTERGLI